MDRVAVTSSNVASIGYDPDTATLEVEFRNGLIYHYYDVPETVHTMFLTAPSKGRYVHEHLKGRYRYRRL